MYPKEKNLSVIEEYRQQSEYQYIFDVLKGKAKNEVIGDVFVSHRLLIGEMKG